MIDGEYHAWLERVRPLTVYVIAVLVAIVLVRAGGAFAVPGVVAVSVGAPAVVLLRGGRVAVPVLLGRAGVRDALLACAVALIASAVLAIVALGLSRAAIVVWSLFPAPPPAARTVVLALVVPNALAAAVVFQGWLQTRLALVVGPWAGALATLAMFAVADRSPIGIFAAAAPVALRATNGSLVASACAYAAFVVVVMFGR